MADMQFARSELKKKTRSFTYVCVRFSKNINIHPLVLALRTERKKNKQREERKQKRENLHRREERRKYSREETDLSEESKASLEVSLYTTGTTGPEKRPGESTKRERSVNREKRERYGGGAAAGEREDNEVVC